MDAMTFGREIEEAASHRLMDRFATAGGNFIDTADAYSAGRSEEIIGSWVKSRPREHVVIATKVRFGSGVNRRGLSRKHILDAVSTDGNRWFRCNRSTTCWTAMRSGSWFRCAARKGWASFRTARCGVAGSPASSIGAPRRPAPTPG